MGEAINDAPGGANGDAAGDAAGDERARAQRLRSRRWLAALVHVLLPGGGHAVLGHLRRGLMWLALIFLLLQVLLYTLTLYTLPLVFVVLWVAPLGDIFWTGRTRWTGRTGRIGPIGPIGPMTLDAEDLPPLGTAAAHLLIVFVAALALQVGARAFISETFRLPSGSMAPTLRIGDHILANKLAYRLGAPARGDVAVFRLPCQQETIFVKRIVALGGDTVEVRCDVVYVNGAPVPQERLEDGDTCIYQDYVEDIDRWQQERCSRYAETLDGIRFETFHDPARPARDQERAQRAGEMIRELAAGALGMRDFPALQHGAPEVPSCGSGLGDERQETLGRIEPSVPEHDRHPGICAPVMRYVVPEDHVFVLGDHRNSSSDSRIWGAVPVDHLEGKVALVWWSSSGPERSIDWSRIGTRVR